MVQVKYFLLMSVLLIASCARPQTASFDPQPVIDDFNLLKQTMSEHYINLEWNIQRRGLNAYQLNQETLKKLRESKSAQQSDQILKEFVAAFRDNHFRIDSAQNNQSFESLPKGIDGKTACTKMAGKVRKNDFPFPLVSDPDFTSVSTSPFPWGLLKLKGKKIGVLRIPTFVAFNYLEICSEEWNRFNLATQISCDENCQDTFLTKLENRLLLEFQNTLNAIQRQHIKALVIDITNNGGGTSWVEGVRDILTPKKLSCSSTGFIRDDRWIAHFKKKITELNRSITTEKDHDKNLKLLAEKKKVEFDLEDASRKCDLSQVWDNPNFHFNCSLVATRPAHPCRTPDEYAS